MADENGWAIIGAGTVIAGAAAGYYGFQQVRTAMSTNPQVRRVLRKQRRPQGWMKTMLEESRKPRGPRPVDIKDFVASGEAIPSHLRLPTPDIISLEKAGYSEEAARDAIREFETSFKETLRTKLKARGADVDAIMRGVEIEPVSVTRVRLPSKIQIAGDVVDEMHILNVRVHIPGTGTITLKGESGIPVIKVYDPLGEVLEKRLLELGYSPSEAARVRETTGLFVHGKSPTLYAAPHMLDVNLERSTKGVSLEIPEVSKRRIKGLHGMLGEQLAETMADAPVTGMRLEDAVSKAEARVYQSGILLGKHGAKELGKVEAINAESIKQMANIQLLPFGWKSEIAQTKDPLAAHEQLMTILFEEFGGLRGAAEFTWTGEQQALRGVMSMLPMREALPFYGAKYPTKMLKPDYIETPMARVKSAVDIGRLGPEEFMETLERGSRLAGAIDRDLAEVLGIKQFPAVIQRVVFEDGAEETAYMSVEFAKKFVARHTKSTPVVAMEGIYSGKGLQKRIDEVGREIHELITATEELTPEQTQRLRRLRGEMKKLRRVAERRKFRVITESGEELHLTMAEILAREEATPGFIAKSRIFGRRSSVIGLDVSKGELKATRLGDLVGFRMNEYEILDIAADAEGGIRMRIAGRIGLEEVISKIHLGAGQRLAVLTRDDVDKIVAERMRAAGYSEEEIARRIGKIDIVMNIAPKGERGTIEYLQDILGEIEYLAEYTEGIPLIGKEQEWAKLEKQLEQAAAKKKKAVLAAKRAKRKLRRSIETLYKRQLAVAKTRQPGTAGLPDPKDLLAAINEALADEAPLNEALTKRGVNPELIDNKLLQAIKTSHRTYLLRVQQVEKSMDEIRAISEAKSAISVRAKMKEERDFFIQALEAKKAELKAKYPRDLSARQEELAKWVEDIYLRGAEFEVEGKTRKLTMAAVRDVILEKTKAGQMLPAPTLQPIIFGDIADYRTGRFKMNPQTARAIENVWDIVGGLEAILRGARAVEGADLKNVENIPHIIKSLRSTVEEMKPEAGELVFGPFEGDLSPSELGHLQPAPMKPGKYTAVSVEESIFGTSWWEKRSEEAGRPIRGVWIEVPIAEGESTYRYIPTAQEVGIRSVYYQGEEAMLDKHQKSLRRLIDRLQKPAESEEYYVAVREALEEYDKQTAALAARKGPLEKLVGRRMLAKSVYGEPIPAPLYMPATVEEAEKALTRSAEEVLKSGKLLPTEVVVSEHTALEAGLIDKKRLKSYYRQLRKNKQRSMLVEAGENMIKRPPNTMAGSTIPVRTFVEVRLPGKKGGLRASGVFTGTAKHVIAVDAVTQRVMRGDFDFDIDYMKFLTNLPQKQRMKMEAEMLKVRKRVLRDVVEIFSRLEPGPERLESYLKKAHSITDPEALDAFIRSSAGRLAAESLTKGFSPAKMASFEYLATLGKLYTGPVTSAVIPAIYGVTKDMDAAVIQNIVGNLIQDVGLERARQTVLGRELISVLRQRQAGKELLMTGRIRDQSKTFSDMVQALAKRAPEDIMNELETEFTIRSTIIGIFSSEGTVPKAQMYEDEVEVVLNQIIESALQGKGKEEASIDDLRRIAAEMDRRFRQVYEQNEELINRNVNWFLTALERGEESVAFNRRREAILHSSVESRRRFVRRTAEIIEEATPAAIREGTESAAQGVRGLGEIDPAGLKSARLANSLDDVAEAAERVLHSGKGIAGLIIGGIGAALAVGALFSLGAAASRDQSYVAGSYPRDFIEGPIETPQYIPVYDEVPENARLNIQAVGPKDDLLLVDIQQQAADMGISIEMIDERDSREPIAAMEYMRYANRFMSG
jgi:hypothetical protein